MDNPDELPEHLKKQEEELKKQIQSVKETEDDMRSNPRYKEFFEPYSESSVESFITRYASMKQMYLLNGDRWVESAENDSLRFTNLAENCLKEILRKKLFNLQCQWRAELIQLQGVEICDDFDVWSKAVFNCPFLEPVTEDELNVYMRYQNSEDYEELYFSSYDWQDYIRIKEAYNPEDDNSEAILIPWYEFYDSNYGTGALLLLPDIRGEKEEFYADLARKKAREKWDEEHKNEVKAVVKDYIPYNDKDFIEKFIRTFEPPKMLKYFNAYYHQSREQDAWDDRMEDALRELEDADEICPVESHPDYRQAIVKAAHDYRNRRIIEALPGVWERYLQQREMGLSFPPDSKDYGIREVMKNLIIEGRLLNNEPPDLNF